MTGTMMSDAIAATESTLRPVRQHGRPVDEAIRYCLVLALIMFSGNPGLPLLFGGWDRIVILFSLVLAVFAGYAVYSGQSRMPLRALWPFGIFCFLLAVHLFSFEKAPLITYAGFLCRVFIAFGVVLVVPRFPRRFTDVMYVLTLVAIPFWVIGLTGLVQPVIRTVSLDGGSRVSLLLHTYEYWQGQPPDVSLRNAGPFWEPGAFAGYLLLAMVFLGAVSNEYARRVYRRRLVVFSAGILTTMSTGGYVLLPVVWVFHLFVLGKRQTLGRVLMLAPAVAAFGVWAYVHFEFVGEKIETQYRTTMELARPVEQQGDLAHVQSRWYLTRVGSVIFDWDYIKRRPLTGWGIAPATRYALHRGGQDLRLAMGNGLTDFIARFGFAGLLAFFVLTWRGFARLLGNRSGIGFFAALIVLLALNGEPFLNYPLFLSLMFLPYCAASPAFIP